MTTLFGNENAPPGLKETLHRLEELAEDERRHAGTRANRRRNGNGNGGVMLEIAKIIIPAALAMGGAYLSVNLQIAELKGQVTALSESMKKVETMLGIGVYRER